MADQITEKNGKKKRESLSYQVVSGFSDLLQIWGQSSASFLRLFSHSMWLNGFCQMARPPFSVYFFQQRHWAPSSMASCSAFKSSSVRLEPLQWDFQFTGGPDRIQNPPGFNTQLISIKYTLSAQDPIEVVLSYREQRCLEIAVAWDCRNGKMGMAVGWLLKAKKFLIHNLCFKDYSQIINWCFVHRAEDMPSNKSHLENVTYSCIVHSLIDMALLTEERLKGMQQGFNYEKSERWLNHSCSKGWGSESNGPYQMIELGMAYDLPPSHRELQELLFLEQNALGTGVPWCKWHGQYISSPVSMHPNLQPEAKNPPLPI